MDVFRASNKKNYMKSSEMVKQISDIHDFLGRVILSRKEKPPQKKEVQKHVAFASLQVWTTSHATSAKSQVCENTRGVVRQSPTAKCPKILRFI